MTYSIDMGLSDPTDNFQTFSLPKFHLGGQLQQAKVTLNGKIAGSIKIANTGTVDPIVTKFSTPNASAFVVGSAPGASCTGSGSSKKCDLWTIKFNAAPGAASEQLTSNLSANVQVVVGPSATLLVSLPASGPIVDNLQFGPTYSQDAYTFTRTYHVLSGAKQTAATVLTEVTAPTSSGTVAGGNAHTWRVDKVSNTVANNNQPASYTLNPCNLVYGSCTVGANSYTVGATHSNLSGFDSASHIFVAPADLAFFTGPGTFNFTEKAKGTSTFSGGGNNVFIPNSNAGGTVDVEYSYSVPEPTSLALMGSGLLAAGFSFRRRNGAKAKKG